MIHALGVDPGFASCGWALYAIQGPEVTLVRMGVIRTAKSNNKANVLATEDNLVRARIVAHELRILLEENAVRLLAIESMSFPRSAPVAAKVALVWGVLAALSDLRNLPIVQASPQKVKKLCGGSKASKEDVQQYVSGLYPQASAEFVAAMPKTQHEHGFDAAAVVLACLESEVFRLVRGG